MLFRRSRLFALPASTRLLIAAAFATFATFTSAAAHAETRTLDGATYRVPDGWRVEEAPRSVTRHSELDRANGRYCALGAYVSTASAGSLDADARADWEMVVAAYGRTGAPAARNVPPLPGWQGRGAGAKFVDVNGLESWVFVHTYSNGTRRVSFTALTNEPGHYRPAIDAFFASIRLPAPSAGASASAPPPPPAAAPTGAKRTTFDDGWSAVEEADWVRASRGAVTVLVHHAAPDQRPFVNPWEGTTAVWNQVVAPRYTGVSGLWVRRGSWDDGDSWGQGKNFASASARDAQGRSVWVALFRSGNNRRWVEIVTPDRAAFEAHLTVVHDGEDTDFEPLNRLANLNKFAVAPADLVGEWASSGGAGVEYVNVYTGQSAGFHFASNTERFTFQKDGTYASEWVGVQNTGGGNSYAGANTRGAYRATGWELTLSNRFKGATETYGAAFEAVKGGRLLYLTRNGNTTGPLVKVR